ncbi:hypothetical protein BTJ68_09914 [Hortaea werneckii EXF-2000]|uniref:CBM6 domain-containing protein n=1 Tax=Hortaea werneckii EXF-2000 TaxID=1157616 RepID=A0A1Z5T0V0_HORWE|nr:hypothetical protein BTJ68_09914 [Hortaea werneckii EXF-2000]
MNMTDTNGNLIQAHGGDIIKSQDSDDTSWYWFGEDKTGEATSGHFQAVNCYKSADFSTWEFVGAVLSPIAGTNISSDAVVERPKVIYNDKNQEYVMWFHSDDSSYGAAMVGVATSGTIDGEYNWQGSFKPFGNDSRDMTVWKDPEDGSAYLIFAASGNADLQVARLTDDYYNDGWTPTDNYYMTASSMAGPWSEPTLLAPEGAYSYLTQNAYDIAIDGSEQTTYLYYGDHWSGNQLGSSTYAFYPVIANSSGLTLHCTGGWSLDIATGQWTDLAYTAITAADSTTPASTLIPCDDACAGGMAANMTADQTFAFVWSGEAGDKVLGIQYVYDGPKNAFKHIGVTVDGETVEGNALPETTRGTTFSQEVPFPATLREGSEVVLTLLDADGSEFFVEGVKVYPHVQ